MITLTEKNSNQQTTISGENIILASEVNEENVVDFVRKPAGARQRITVLEALSVIASISSNLVSTDVSGVETLINIDRVVDVSADGDRKGVVIYRSIGTNSTLFLDEEDYEILHKIYTKQGKDSYLFTTVSDSDGDNTILVGHLLY